MVDSIFRYPGGKAYHADWIATNLREHRAYVEPFAGSAAVLVAKPASYSEIINDCDGDITQFMLALRDREQELIKWLNGTPYSFDLHRKYVEQFHAGYRPDNQIERAGRFFFLRYSSFAAKYSGVSGFSTSAARDAAMKFRNATEKLERFSERLRSVQIENRDYEIMFDRFDAEDTLFYCDPPYVDAGDELYSHDGAFDHDRFVDALREVDGYWAVSYEKLPAGIETDETHTIERDRTQYMSKGHENADGHGTERLVMNYDPTETTSHSETDQTTLTGNLTQ